MMKSRSSWLIEMPWWRTSARAIASAVSRSLSTSVPSRSNSTAANTMGIRVLAWPV
jgi:hypothetical protein